jgi:FemAB-related protein (PEP-CTERM system-associated)
MRLTLPSSDEELDASFKSKLRSQVKKSRSYGATVHFGGSELLDEFYRVFAHNMRDLGTPVFSRTLFAEILQHFRGDAELCVVRSENRPIAGGILVHSRGVTEVPSASSLREFNRTGANMLMYRHLLSRAIERGSHTFDFGRSSEDSGTYKFKAQWGAVPHPATWQYYVRKGDPNDMRPDAGGKQRLVELWQKLPVELTKWIGPPIVRGIP